METILQFDKLFYHFSHSDIQERMKKETLGSSSTARKGKRIETEDLKGDKEIAFYLNLISRNSSFFAFGACVHMINAFVLFM